MSEGNPPRSGLDPLAVAVLAAAALVAVALVAWLLLSLRNAPSQPTQKSGIATGVEAAVEDAKRFFQLLAETETPPEKPPVSKAPGPAPSAARPAAPPTTGGAGRIGIALPAGQTWTYAVRLEPEVWKDAVLVYRSVAERDAIVVETDFRHSKGNMAFRLGTYAPRHPSHAQIRFPGFFMHGAYFDFPLAPGKRFSWEYPWQMADNRLREGRVRRWDAVVGGSETVSVPAGRFDAIRLDATVSYIDGGKALATVNELIWYAPEIRQIVKVVRTGRSPDEAGQRIVADLAEVK